MMRRYSTNNRKATGRSVQGQSRSKPLSIAVAIGAILVLVSLLILLAIKPLTSLGDLLTSVGYASELEHSSVGADLRDADHPNKPTNAQKSSWQLQLVNAQNKLPEGYMPDLLTLSNGEMVDERCYPELQAMMDDCRSAGYQPMICSAYRSVELQRQILDASVASRVSQGLTREAAEAETLRSVASPGYSEHHLGLAVDIVDSNYQLLDESQAERTAQQWLMENSWRYGFILRYPVDKTSITNIDYEPWHYRYVGKEAAADIYRSNICLEEYLM